MKLKISRILIAPLLATLLSCGGEKSSTELKVDRIEAEAVDPFLTQAKDKTRWSSKIYRVKADSEAGIFLGAMEDLHLLAVFDKGKPAPEPSAPKEYVFKLACGNKEAAFAMRAAFGTISDPDDLEFNEAPNSDFQVILSAYTLNTEAKTGPRELSCAPSDDVPSGSIDGANLVALNGATPEQDRVYLEQRNGPSGENEMLMVDPDCEDAVLKTLGLGSRDEQKSDLWSKISGKPAQIFRNKTRIPLVCTQSYSGASFKELCENREVLGSDYVDLYSALRKIYAPGPQGANCSQFESTVSNAIKSSKTLNLSKNATGGFDVKAEVLLKLELFNIDAQKSGKLHFTEIERINLEGQNFSQDDLALILARISDATGPLTVDIRGPVIFNDFSFLETIKNKSNINIVYDENQVSVNAISCPVDGSNASVSKYCLKTIPFYDLCLKHYSKGGDPSFQKAVAAYLTAYYPGEVLNKTSDPAAQCMKFTQELVGRKTLVIQKAEIETLKPFDKLYLLEALIVPGNKLNAADLSDLSYLPALAEINLADNKIEKIPGSLVFNSEVAALDLSNNALTEMNGIQQFSHIAVLKLSGNKLMSLQGIERLAASLNYLDVQGTQIFARNNREDLQRVAQLSELSFLDVADAGIDLNVTELSSNSYWGWKLPKLIYLNLSGNAISGDASFLGNINGSNDIQNKFISLVAHRTSLVNLQAYIALTSTIKTELYSKDEPKLGAIEESWANPVERYKILYGELAKDKDPFADVQLSRSEEQLIPRFFFDPSAVNCQANLSLAHPDAKRLCGLY